MLFRSITENYMLLNIIAYFLIAFSVTYLLTPFNIRFSRKHLLIDNPTPRGIHGNPIPLAGGLSIAIPVIIFQFYYYSISPEDKVFLYLAIGGLAIVLLGYLDDKKSSLLIIN